MMILNVSGRCDVVAFFFPWFMNRYKEGYIDVRNPFYQDLVSRIYFCDVDAILFCTKNPIPLVDYIQECDKEILLHVTLTPYKEDIEPNVPSKKKIIEAIKELSKYVGKDRLYIRYDPIFLSDKYTIQYHIKAFDSLCAILDGYVKHFIISFINDYKNVKKKKKSLNIKEFVSDDYQKIGENFSRSAKRHHMTVQTCFEEINLVEYGFIKRDCVDEELAHELTGKSKFKRWKARKENRCHCVEMVDIGVYNSCKHFCKYCYANYDENRVIANYHNHDPNSSLLIGHLNHSDIIKIRK